MIKKLDLHRLLYKCFIETGIDDTQAGSLEHVLSNRLHFDNASLLRELTQISDALLKTKAKVIAGTS